MSAAGRTSTAVIQPCLLDVGERAPGRDPADFYPTPAWCVDAILPHLPLGGAVLEPSCGDGAILERVQLARAHNDGLYGIELDPGRARIAQTRISAASITAGDFLYRATRLTVPNLGLIIGNPPFSLAAEFVKACLLVARPTGATTAMLLRLAFLEAEERASLHAMWPSDIYPLASRPSFTGAGTDATAYAWFVWGPGRGGRWFAPMLRPGAAS